MFRSWKQLSAQLSAGSMLGAGLFRGTNRHGTWALEAGASNDGQECHVVSLERLMTHVLLQYSDKP